MFTSHRLMILYTFKGRMTVRHKWNSKYFDTKTFEDINAKALEYFNDFVEAGASNGVDSVKPAEANGNGK